MPEHDTAGHREGNDGELDSFGNAPVQVIHGRKRNHACRDVSDPHVPNTSRLHLPIVPPTLLNKTRCYDGWTRRQTRARVASPIRLSTIVVSFSPFSCSCGRSCSGVTSTPRFLISTRPMPRDCK